MKSNTNPLSTFTQQGLLEVTLEHVRMLHMSGIPSVPLCRPTSGSSCTGARHSDPCGDAGKKPLVAGYPAMADVLPQRGHLFDLVRKFFPCNLGIVVPRWMVVVEADTPAGETEIVKLEGGGAGPVRERRGGRGRGWLFRVGPNNEVPGRTRAGRSQAIDILTGGSIFVAPPSVHRSGHIYDWVEDNAPWEISAPPLPHDLRHLALEGSRRRSSGRDSDHTAFEPGLSEGVAFYLAARKRLTRLWMGDGKTGGDTSQSGYDYSFAQELRDCKLSIREIAEAIAVRPGAHRRDKDYCILTARRAAGRKS